MTQYKEVWQEFAHEILYDLEAIRESHGILCVNLIILGKVTLKISFDSHLSYRKLDEGDALKFLAELKSHCALGRSFYQAENSDFLNWFIDQGHGVRNRDNLTHYIIMTIDDIIEVIASDDPLLEHARDS